MDKWHIFMVLFITIGIVFGLSLMFWDALTKETRIVEECKQDCSDLNLDYFKAKPGAWNQDNCICTNQKGEPFMIW